MILSRKNLLAAGTALAAASAMAPTLAAATPSPAPARTPEPSLPPLQFDQARFAAILGQTARHRQAFSSTKISGGTVLDEMVSSMYAYEVDLGEGPGTMHTVAVLYHGPAITLAFSDALWQNYFRPAIPHVSPSLRAMLGDNDVPAGTGNPYLHRNKNAALEDDSSVEALVARGSHFFVCNNALQGFSYAISHALGMQALTVYKALLGGLVDGAMAVPAGVMAVNACQEAHFTFLQATL